MMRALFRLSACLASALLLSASYAAEQPSIADWAQRAPIEVPAGQKGLAEFALTDEVLDAAEESLADLRIFDDHNTETACILRSAAEKSTTVPLTVTLFNRTYTPNTSSSVTVDFAGQVLKNRLEVVTSGSEFWRKASLESSSDGALWHMVAEGLMLVRKKSEDGVSGFTKDVITFPDNDERYLRITVFNGPGDEKIEFERVTAQRLLREPAETVDIPIASSGVTENEKHHSTEILLDLAWKKLPLHAVSLSFSDDNFFRGYSLYGRDSETHSIPVPREDAPAGSREVETPWDYLAGGAIYRFSSGRNPEASLSIALGGRGCRYLKIVVHNGNDSPLRFTGARVTRLVKYAAFQAATDQTYMLYFANPKTSRPSYDLPRYIDRLRAEGVTTAVLGKPERNPATSPSAPLPWSERNKWLIWAALIVVVLVLGVLIAKQMKAPRDSGSQPA